MSKPLKGIRTYRYLLALLVAACGGVPPTVANRGGVPMAEPSREVAVVERTVAGGVLELRGDRDAAHADATRMMAQHCGQYTITREGIEQLGEFDQALQEAPHAYRLHYICAR